MSKFVTDFFAVFRSKGFDVLLTFGAAIIYARVLGPEGNGLLAGVLIYPAIFISFATLGLRQAAVYFVGNDVKSTETIFSSVITVWLITSTISVIACIYILKYIAGSSYTPLMIALAVGAIPFNIFIDYASGILLGKNKVKDFATITWLPSLFRFLGAVLFVWIMGLGVAGALIAPMIAMIVMSGVMIYYLNKYISFNYTFDFKAIKSMISLGIVYSIALFVINLNYKVDQMLLEYLSTSYELGIYEKGVGMVEKVWQIPMLLGTIIFAGSANAKDSKLYSLKVAKLLRVSLLACFFILLGIGLVAPFLVTLFYGQEFFDSALVIQLLIPGVLFMVFFKVLNMDLAGRGRPWLSLIAMVPAVLVNISLNIYLIPEYGADGVAVASSISYTVAAFIFLFVYIKGTRLTFTEILTYRKDDFLIIMKKLRKNIK